MFLHPSQGAASFAGLNGAEKAITTGIHRFASGSTIGSGAAFATFSFTLRATNPGRTEPGFWHLSTGGIAGFRLRGPKF